MRGLSLFSRTNSKRHWNLASWHSPHSLTLSWVLVLNVGRPTLTPHARWHSKSHGIGPAVHFGFGTLARFSAYRNGNGWQLGASLLGVTVSWMRQRPMWYRDLYQRLRDEKDQREGMLWLQDSHPHKLSEMRH